MFSLNQSKSNNLKKDHEPHVEAIKIKRFEKRSRTTCDQQQTWIMGRQQQNEGQSATPSSFQLLQLPDDAT